MKRSYNILFLTMLFFAFYTGNNCNAQTPSWAWAGNATSFGGSIYVEDMGSDAAGNTYTLGNANVGIQFGSLPRLHGRMFLVKHNSQGKPVWSFAADCGPFASATDSVGNSYITGYFSDTLQLGSNTLICQGVKDIFVAKFDSAGNVVWAKRAGGIGKRQNMPPIQEDEAYSLGIDAAGNCYIGGIVIASDTSAAMFDSIAVFPPVSSSFPIMFTVLAKYNAAGQIQWVRTINSPQLLTRAMTVSKQGQCFMSGMFSDTINYGGTTLINSGYYDFCLASFDPNGNLSWVKSFGGSGGDAGDALAADKQGNVFLTGSFEDTVHFGSFTLIEPGSSGTLFIAKLDSTGNVVWASQTTGTGYAGDSKIAIDSAGNSYLNSYFNNTIVVGSQTFSSGPFHDILISKWDATGSPVWAVAAPGGSYEYPGGIVLDPAASAYYVSGTFDSSINFGNYSLSAGLGTNFFLAKLSNVVSGLPGNIRNSDFTVFPNPALQNFSVQFRNEVVGRKAKFQLYSGTGQLVHEAEFINSSLFVVERNELPSGLYMYKLYTEDKEVKTGKIVLQ